MIGEFPLHGPDSRCTACGMPLVGGVGHNCPSLTSMPSRSFLIRQAIRTAARQFYPGTIAILGWTGALDRAARIIENDFAEAADFRRAVVSAYNVLLETHGGQPCR